MDAKPEMTAEEKLLSAIFGEDYGVGLPKPVSPDWVWAAGFVKGETNCQDKAGRWFHLSYEPDYSKD